MLSSCQWYTSSTQKLLTAHLRRWTPSSRRQRTSSPSSGPPSMSRVDTARTARFSSTMRRAKSISDAQALLHKGAQAWATLRRLLQGGVQKAENGYAAHEESKV